MTPTQPIPAGRARFVVACLATVALALAACTAASPSASPPPTIHVLEQATNVNLVHVGSLEGCTDTTCQGDYYVGDDPLTDAATGKTVGTLLFECFVVDVASGLYHCPDITIDLTGRGQIVYTSNVYIGGPWNPAPWPITGGSGEFLGATGTVTSPENSTASAGDFVITFTK